MPTSPRSELLANQLVASACKIESARASPGLYRVFLQLLACGEPVTVTRITAAADRPVEDIEPVVAAWRDTEYDKQGRIIGSPRAAKSPTPGARSTRCSCLRLLTVAPTSSRLAEPPEARYV